MISAQSVCFQRGRRTVLADVSLALAPGRVVVAIGPNGAGKSTLLKLLAGELRPSSGTVTVGERTLGSVPVTELARIRAVMPQAAPDAFSLTVHEIVRLGAIAGGARDPDGTAEAALAAVGLDGWGGRRAKALSGGERQRVAFARALAQVPAPADQSGARTLLLDEPTASLDLARQLALLERAKDFAGCGGAVFIVLHDLNLAAEFADEVVVLENGRVVLAGAPSPNLFERIVSQVYGVPGAASRVPANGMAFVLPQARVSARA